MKYHDAMMMFKKIYAAGDVSESSQALHGLAIWIAQRHRILTEDDLELLAIVGAVLLGQALEDDLTGASNSTAIVDRTIERMWRKSPPDSDK